MESYNDKKFHAELQKLGLPVSRPFVQDNHSSSKKGVLRGLHYQCEPHMQGKLVRVISGSVFDVAVDIRPGSPTFYKWVSTILCADIKSALWIPEGFAHGFLSLEDSAELVYKNTDYYKKDCERRIRWNDSSLSIPWPSVGLDIILSEKDA